MNLILCQKFLRKLQMLPIFILIFYSSACWATNSDEEEVEASNKPLLPSLVNPLSQPSDEIQQAVTVPTYGSITHPALQEECLTQLQACKNMAKFSVPFILSICPTIAQGIGNNIFLAQMQDQEVIAAGPLISTFTNSVTGTMGAVLATTGILGGRRFGMGDYEGIRNLVRNGWCLSVILGGISAPIYLYAENILLAANTPSQVAGYVDKFFVPYTISTLLPTYWFLVDQQLSLALRRPYAPLVFSSIRTGLTLLLSYPLALGAWGFPQLGISGLSYASGIATAGTLLAQRAYYLCDSDFRQYPLLSRQCSTYICGLGDFLKVGIPLGINRFMEWGNLTAITIMLGKLGKDVLNAEQMSLQPILGINFLLIALTQSASIAVSINEGKVKKLAQDRKVDDAETTTKNSKKLGTAAVIFGTGVAGLSSILFISLSDELLHLFGGEASYDTFISPLAHTMLVINSVALLADAPRNIIPGALSGYGDVKFSPITSFTTMSLISLPITAALLFAENISPAWAFGIRGIAMLTAGSLITHRWYHKQTIISEAQQDRQRLRNYASMSGGRAWYNPIGWFKYMVNYLKNGE